MACASVETFQFLLRTAVRNTRVCARGAELPEGRSCLRPSLANASSLGWRCQHPDSGSRRCLCGLSVSGPRARAVLCCRQHRAASAPSPPGSTARSRHACGFLSSVCVCKLTSRLAREPACSRPASLLRNGELAAPKRWPRLERALTELWPCTAQRSERQPARQSRLAGKRRCRDRAADLYAGSGRDWRRGSVSFKSGNLVFSFQGHPAKQSCVCHRCLSLPFPPSLPLSLKGQCKISSGKD